MLRADRGGLVVKINQNCSSSVEKRVALHVITPPLVIGERSVAMSVSVSVCFCVSLRENISGIPCPFFAEFLTDINYGRGPVLLWRCCDMLCTSGFTDDVTQLYSLLDMAMYESRIIMLQKSNIGWLKSEELYYSI